MEAENELRNMHAKIQAMKSAAEKLQEDATGFPALRCNLVRILASIRMLEINVSDLVDLDGR